MYERADWVTRFESEDYSDAMARLVAMHRRIADRVRAASKSDKRLQVTILAISALTSGALWILVGIALPVIGAWVGAALSTLVAGLTLYQLTVGPGREVERLNELFSEFGRSLAHAREHRNNFSWHNFKHLESSYIKIGLCDPTQEEIRTARYTGML